MKTVPFLLFALNILLPQESAQDVLQNIEEKLLKAKSLSIRFHLSRKNVTGTSQTSGLLLLKEGNKARAEVRDSKGMTSELVSDGSRLYFRILKEKTVFDTPANLGTILAQLAVRNGVEAVPTSVYLYTAGSQDKAKALESAPATVTEVRWGSEEKTHTTLQFRTSSTAEVKLWYDPKSYKLSKRVDLLKDKFGEAVITQTYDEFVFDGDIPDDRFKVPVEK